MPGRKYIFKPILRAGEWNIGIHSVACLKNQKVESCLEAEIVEAVARDVDKNKVIKDSLCAKTRSLASFQ